MGIATASYRVDATKTNDGYLFTYKKAKLGLKLYIRLLWLSAVLSGYIAYRVESNSTVYDTFFNKLLAGAFYWAFFTLAIPAALLLILNLFRNTGSFSLTSKGILLNGTTYPYSQVKSIYIRAFKRHAGLALPGTETGFFALTGLEGMRTSTMVSTKGIDYDISILGTIQKKNFKICFMFGNTEKTIASEISEDTAIQIFQKIDSISW
ncbi:MAG: hypothetical protein JST86_00910 [Bacteroidetes bacterium]|nr:hypothetical protein [Bacteroidota bacterium]